MKSSIIEGSCLLLFSLAFASAQNSTTADLSTRATATKEYPTEVFPLNRSQPPAMSADRIFEDAVASKSARVGRTFDKWTIDTIAIAASRRSYDGHFATFEFVNYMKETVTDFQLYHEERETPEYQPAPSHIAGKTKELFAFREPICCFQNVAFSYSIPFANVRIAIRLRLANGDGIGLSFLSETESLGMYYTTKKGLPGLYDYKFIPRARDGTSYPATAQILIRYQNWYAKATMKLRGQHEANIKIELVDLP